MLFVTDYDSLFEILLNILLAIYYILAWINGNGNDIKLSSDQ